MLVGGAVRDLLIGRRPKDYDLLTSAHIAEVRLSASRSRWELCSGICCQICLWPEQCCWLLVH